MQLSGIGHYGFGVEAPSYASLVASAEEAITDIERSLVQQVPAAGWAADVERLQPYDIIPPGPTLPDDRGSWIWWGLAGLVVVGSIYYFGKKKT